MPPDAAARARFLFYNRRESPPQDVCCTRIVAIAAAAVWSPPTCVNGDSKLFKADNFQAQWSLTRARASGSAAYAPVLRPLRARARAVTSSDSSPLCLLFFCGQSIAQFRTLVVDTAAAIANSTTVKNGAGGLKFLLCAIAFFFLQRNAIRGARAPLLSRAPHRTPIVIAAASARL